MFDDIFDFDPDRTDQTSAKPRDERADNPDGLTKLQRQRPNGQLTPHDPPDAPGTPNGVDRQPNSGQFASRERDPVPLLRDHDTGRLSPDEFAVGNFFGEKERERR